MTSGSNRQGNSCDSCDCCDSGSARQTYLTWTEDNLLRQVSYQGQREDKPATLVIRPVPHRPRSER